MPRFNYAARSLDKQAYRGRTIPAKIESVTEKIKENGNLPIPTLVVNYSPPDGTLEIQSYEGGEDCIPKDSDLGRFIAACEEKLEIADIGANEFKDLEARYVWLNVIPLRTPHGMTHKRYPSRWMEGDDVEKHFGIPVPLKFLTGHEAMLESKLDGTRTGALTARCMSIPELKSHIKEVSDAITTGVFIEWLQEHTTLRVVEDETSGGGSVLKASGG